jgi:hypothetical protein
MSLLKAQTVFIIWLLHIMSKFLQIMHSKAAVKATPDFATTTFVKKFQWSFERLIANSSACNHLSICQSVCLSIGCKNGFGFMLS